MKKNRPFVILLCAVLAMMNLTGFAFAEESVKSSEIIKVSYLGPEGTYTEEAAQFWFRNGEVLIPKATVNDAVTDLMTGAADYAVIPQENTLGGAVVNYVDALIAAEDAYVVGEVVLSISQTLMGVPGAALADIKTVCSHAQGLTQSAVWRAEHLPEATRIVLLPDCNEPVADKEKEEEIRRLEEELSAVNEALQKEPGSEALRLKQEEDTRSIRELRENPWEISPKDIVTYRKTAPYFVFGERRWQYDTDDHQMFQLREQLRKHQMNPDAFVNRYEELMRMITLENE